MRILLSTLLVAVATAFQPIQTPQRVATKLEVARRDVLVTIVGGVLAPAAAANALSHGMQNREGSHTHGSTWFFDENIENVREESQMPTGGKLDLNGATVVRSSINKIAWLSSTKLVFGSTRIAMRRAASNLVQFCVSANESFHFLTCFLFYLCGLR